MTGAVGDGLSRAGFTLLEVLISVSIFAVVIASVYGAYRATFTTVDGVVAESRVSAAARAILERVADDLAMVVTDEEGYLRGARGDISGQRADSVAFIANAHLPLTRGGKNGGRARVEYTVEESETGRIDLYRLDRLVRPGEDTDEEQGEILARGLLAFQLTYRTADGSDSEEWDSGGTEREGAEEHDALPQLPPLVMIEVVVPASEDDETGTLYRTAVALPAGAGGRSER